MMENMGVRRKTIQETTEKMSKTAGITGAGRDT
jgi:hypothetical protein